MTAPISLLAPIQIIVDLLQPVLVFIHDTMSVSWGFSIVLLTVFVRALMAPLTVKQFKSMQAMVSVAPQLKELQAKYKDDKQRQQQEVMKFYSENKINPFASCLPLLAQLPFFIGLFYLLQSDLRREICEQTAKPCGDVASSNGTEQFLFIPDLTDKASGSVLVVLIVLYISSQLLSSFLTPSTGDRNQKMLMYALPFVFTIFIIGFPAGLIVYWITTNLWTVGQGYLIRRKLGPISTPKLAAADAIAGGAGGGGTGVPGGISGLMAKLSAGSGAPAKESAAPAAKPKPSGPPPRPPRQKKKRSGRRR
ncbi:MAG TPA: YidC/Oxa1 family membrane protein insertase [Solirubrobacteraceae bacterium]|nr:YidC/Oxa1 family membrane protein insertase [Solirubrobacteraceae bacterium]